MAGTNTMFPKCIRGWVGVLTEVAGGVDINATRSDQEILC